MFDFKFRNYQEGAVNFCMSRKTANLAMYMGTGKTAVLTQVIVNLITYEGANRIFLFAPLNVIAAVWVKELKLAGISFTNVCDYKIEEFSEILKVTSEVILIPSGSIKATSYLSLLLKHKIKTDYVFIDEATKFKSYKMKQNRGGAPHIASALLKYVNFTQPKKTITMSGEYITKNIEDIFMVDLILNSGHSRLGNTLNEFRSRFAKSQFNHATFGVIPTYDKNSTINVLKVIYDCFYLVTAEEMRDEVKSKGVAEPIRIVKKFVLNKQIRDVYDTLASKGGLLDSINDLELINGDSTIRLRQLLSGFIYYSHEDSWLNGLPEPTGGVGVVKLDYILQERLKIVESIRNNNNNDNCLIFVQFKEDFESLKLKYPEAEIMTSETIRTKDIVERWNNGEINILLANPASVSHGLNLQHGGSYMIWWSIGYSYESFIQASVRLSRQGQARQTEMYIIVAEDTIESTESSEGVETMVTIKKSKVVKGITLEKGKTANSVKGILDDAQEASRFFIQTLKQLLEYKNEKIN